MRADRGNRFPVWGAWVGVAALAGLTVGPVIAALAAAGCAAALTVEEVGYRRRARSYFRETHLRTTRRHDAILDGWMALREDDLERPSTRLADDVTRRPTARFVTTAARAADTRDVARSSDYRSVVAYRDAVDDLDHAWRRLELTARGLDMWGDARRWSRDRLPASLPAAVAPLLPVARSAAQAAWRAAESRLARDTRTDA